MKQFLRRLRRPFVWLFITPIYWLGCLCYDRKYLTGRNFSRWHFSEGWQWILKYWFGQKVLGRNGHVPWPIPPHAAVGVPENIVFDPDDMRIFQVIGCYYQGINAKVVIGKGSTIAPGAGFITANHGFQDVHASQPGKDVVLGENCWVGMNAVILPGVRLGPHTLVGAGAVVTKSFPEGWCVIAGNPARKIREVPHEEN